MVVVLGVHTSFFCHALLAGDMGRTPATPDPSCPYGKAGGILAHENTPDQSNRHSQQTAGARITRRSRPHARGQDIQQQSAQRRAHPRRAGTLREKEARLHRDGGEEARIEDGNSATNLPRFFSFRSRPSITARSAHLQPPPTAHRLLESATLSFRRGGTPGRRQRAHRRRQRDLLGRTVIVAGTVAGR